MGTEVKCNIICFLCQGQYRLIHGLVAFNISGEHESPFWPIIAEIFDSLLQLGCKHVLHSRPKEITIQLPPGSAEFRAEVKRVHIDRGCCPLNNMLQLLEAMCIVLHSQRSIYLWGEPHEGASYFLRNHVLVDHVVVNLLGLKGLFLKHFVHEIGTQSSVNALDLTKMLFNQISDSSTVLGFQVGQLL